MRSHPSLRRFLGLGFFLLVGTHCSAQEPSSQAPGETSEPAVRAGSEAAAVDWKKLHAMRSARQRGVIRDFFAGRRGGVFVDVGAAHYRDLSMTFFLEKEFGWSGVAIDALEEWASGYEANRPRTRFFRYIVTDHEGAREPFYRLKGAIGSTALKDRADHLEKDWDREVTEVRVPTITLDALLERAAVEKIDFLSMDIEGAEPIALAGFDIRRFRPELVGIEVFPQNEGKILRYFESHGYRRLDQYLERHPSDWFFTCEEPSDCAGGTG